MATPILNTRVGDDGRHEVTIGMTDFARATLVMTDEGMADPAIGDVFDAVARYGVVTGDIPRRPTRADPTPDRRS